MFAGISSTRWPASCTARPPCNYSHCCDSCGSRGHGIGYHTPSLACLRAVMQRQEECSGLWSHREAEGAPATCTGGSSRAWIRPRRAGPFAIWWWQCSGKSWPRLADSRGQLDMVGPANRFRPTSLPRFCWSCREKFRSSTELCQCRAARGSSSRAGCRRWRISWGSHK